MKYRHYTLISGRPWNNGDPPVPEFNILVPLDCADNFEEFIREERDCGFQTQWFNRGIVERN